MDTLLNELNDEKLINTTSEQLHIDKKNAKVYLSSRIFVEFPDDEYINLAANELQREYSYEALSQYKSCLDDWKVIQRQKLKQELANVKIEFDKLKDEESPYQNYNDGQKRLIDLAYKFFSHFGDEE